MVGGWKISTALTFATGPGGTHEVPIAVDASDQHFIVVVDFHSRLTAVRTDHATILGNPVSASKQRGTSFGREPNAQCIIGAEGSVP
jgi:hypothetical protein